MRRKRDVGLCEIAWCYRAELPTYRKGKTVWVGMYVLKKMGRVLRDGG